MRRANDKIAAPALSQCPQCHALILPHHVCPECGYYKGKEVVAKAE
jgi:large subunit ribosomal protein L32